MYESADYSFIWWIILIQAIVCALAAEHIADTKNRNRLNYFLLGFFLGIIGLLVAIGVPALESEGNLVFSEPPSRLPDELDSYYIDFSIPHPPLLQGYLAVKSGKLEFETDEDWLLEIPLSEIMSIKILDKNTLPSTFPYREFILDKRSVLKLTHGDDETSYFSMDSAYMDAFVRTRLRTNRGSGKGGFQQDARNTKDDSAEKQCPFCAELIKAEAVKCKHCGSDLVEATPVIQNGSSGTITHDIQIEDQLAFGAGEQVQIEAVSPDPNQPEFKYVVFSKNLNKRFRLSDTDISVS